MFVIARGAWCDLAKSSGTIWSPPVSYILLYSSAIIVSWLIDYNNWAICILTEGVGGHMVSAHTSYFLQDIEYGIGKN